MNKYEKLRKEFEYLRSQGVSTIDPLIVLGYMDFIDQIEAAEERTPTAELDSLDAAAREAGRINNV